MLFDDSDLPHCTQLTEESLVIRLCLYKDEFKDGIARVHLYLPDKNKFGGVASEHHIIELKTLQQIIVLLEQDLNEQK